MAAPTVRTRKFLTNRLMGRKQFVRPATPFAAAGSEQEPRRSAWKLQSA